MDLAYGTIEGKRERGQTDRQRRYLRNGNWQGDDQLLFGLRERENRDVSDDERKRKSSLLVNLDTYLEKSEKGKNFLKLLHDLLLFAGSSRRRDKSELQHHQGEEKYRTPGSGENGHRKASK